MLKKVKTLLLIFGMLVLVVLGSSCTKTPDDTESNTDATIEYIELFKDGNLRFEIIYADDIKSKATRFANDLSKTLGVHIDCKSETEECDAEFEVLIGGTNREASENAMQKIKVSADWLIQVDGNKIVIAAGSIEAYTVAFDYIQSNFIQTEQKNFFLPENCGVSDLIIDDEIYQQLAKSTIVYSADASERVVMAALKLKNKLNDCVGDQSMRISNDTGPQAEYEIWIGETKRDGDDAPDLFIYDYLIQKSEKTIQVKGGCGYAIENAINLLIEQIDSHELCEKYEYHFDTSLFNPLALNPTSFHPVWEGKITVPEWMTDIDEKIYAITDPTSRPMSAAHRGDRVHYPDNSLEGGLSAILLGMDAIEVDLQLTKDNVLVLFHDLTLERNTNVNDMKGKNGLPNSVNLCDWTYAELQQLSLLNSNWGTATKYKIPSFYEYLLAVDNRCFLRYDVKVENALTVADLYEITAIADCFASVFHRNIDSTLLLKYATSNPNLESLKYFYTLKSYLALPGHALRTKVSWVGTGSIEDYRAAYISAPEKLVGTDHVDIMSAFIAQYEPSLK